MKRCFTILSTLAGISMAVSCAAAPFAYVANEKSGTLSIIDTANDELLTEIKIGDKPRGAAIAGGAIEAESSRKTIQHLEGGIVGRILVKDGDLVEAGQPLVRLDDTRPRAANARRRATRRLPC